MSPRTRQRGYFEPAFVDAARRRALAGRRDHTLRLWQLLVFELWHRQYLDAPAAVQHRAASGVSRYRLSCTPRRVVTPDSLYPFNYTAAAARRSDELWIKRARAVLPKSGTEGGTCLAEIGSCDLPAHTPVAVFITAFEPGGTERQMTELIRRLDPAAVRGPRRLLSQAGRVAAACRRARRPRSRNFPSRALPGRRRLAQMLRIRPLVPARADCGGADMRPLREHLRLAWSGPGRGPGADRQPARTEPRQDRRRRSRCSGSPIDPHTKVVANSRAARQMLETEGLAPQSIAVIPNGVDLASFVPRKHRGAVRTIITVANLRPEKSHETLLAAAATLVGAHPDAAVQNRRRRAAPRGAGTAARRPRRSAAGRVPRPPRRRRPRCSRMPMSSCCRRAPRRFPTARSRRWQRGCRSSPARSAACSISIEDGRTGMLVPPGDPCGAGRALRVADRRAGARGGDRGARRASEVQQRYSFDRMVASFEDLYLSGLRGARAGAARTSVRRRASDMCGIAGRFNYDPLQPVDRDVLVAMTDAVAHRGPDAAGYYLGAGHRPRPPPAEHHRPRRPAISRSRTKTAPSGSIFNGEIYNFAEVRAELDRARPPVPHRLRHRSHRPRLRAVGRTLRRSVPRHVRVRGVGRARAPAAARARSARRQAALLRRVPGRGHRVRLGDQVAARGSATCRATGARRRSTRT